MTKEWADATDAAHNARDKCNWAVAKIMTRLCNGEPIAIYRDELIQLMNEWKAANLRVGEIEKKL